VLCVQWDTFFGPNMNRDDSGSGLSSSSPAFSPGLGAGKRLDRQDLESSNHIVRAAELTDAVVPAVSQGEIHGCFVSTLQGEVEDRRPLGG